MKRLDAASSVTFTLRLPVALRERLDVAAHQRRQRPSALVQEALEAFLEASSVPSVPTLERYPHPPPVSAQAAPFEDLWLSMTSARSGSDEATAASGAERPALP